jgi:hypothetical protein
MKLSFLTLAIFCFFLSRWRNRNIRVQVIFSSVSLGSDVSQGTKQRSYYTFTDEANQKLGSFFLSLFQLKNDRHRSAVFSYI